MNTAVFNGDVLNAAPVVIPPTGLTLVVSSLRFRLGDTITVSFQAPETPASVPVMTVTGPGLSYSAQVPLSSWPLSFSARFRAPAGTTLGTLSVSVSFSAVTGTAYTGTASLGLVGGGDSGGRVISVHSVGQPSSKILAHLDSGRLVMGSNPTL